jgi:hypothetical protein
MQRTLGLDTLQDDWFKMTSAPQDSEAAISPAGALHVVFAASFLESRAFSMIPKSKWNLMLQCNSMPSLSLLLAT